MLSNWRHDLTPPSRTAHPQPVTVGYAAVYAPGPRRTVARWVHEGLLPMHASSPRRPRIPLRDVDMLTGPAGRGSDEADERLWTPPAQSRWTPQTRPT